MKKLLHAVTGIGLVASLAWALPNYKDLCLQLDKIPGWKLSECEGMKMTNPIMGEVVTATKTYTKGEKRVEVTVVSGMQAMMMWGPYSMGTRVENDESLIKIEKINGFNVGITYDKKGRSGGIVVQLRPNAVLAATFENMIWQDALDTLKRIDWKKLRSLFQ